MAIAQLKYELHDGYIHNWLAAGPQAIPVTDLDPTKTSDVNFQIINKYHQKSSGITRDPVERGPLTEGVFTIGSYEGSWSYVRCRGDHFVDHSASYQRLSYLRSWAYSQLVLEESTDVILVLTTNGPADLWLNGRHLHRQEHFQAPHPKGVKVKTELKAGINQVLVRFESVTSGDCPDVMALRVLQASDLPASGQPIPISRIHVEIPSLIEDLERRNELEGSFEAVYMRRDVFTREDKIEVCWPESLEKYVKTMVRLQARSGPTYAQAEVDGKSGDTLFLSYGGQLVIGPYKAVLMPLHWEYYERNLRIIKEFPFWLIGTNNFSTSPYKSYAERWQEALTHATYLEGNLYAEMAKVALGKVDSVLPATVRNAIDLVDQRTPGSPLLLAGFLRMLAGFNSQPKFLRGLRKEIKDCILGYKYWSDEPGVDLMAFDGECDQILFHSCEILAGQKYPELPFLNNNQSGHWHRSHGEALALAWLKERCSRGFGDWNSDESFEKELVALALLADFEDDDRISSLAIVAMDKIFYALALNSFQGVLASSQGRGNSDAVRGGVLAGDIRDHPVEMGSGTIQPAHRWAGKPGPFERLPDARDYC